MPVEQAPDLFGESESVARIAAILIPQFHPTLVTARIQYLCTTKEYKKNGVLVIGKAVKVPANYEYSVEADFQIIVSTPLWNDYSEEQRRAAVDSLLSRCVGEENEKTGEMKWKKREPTGEFVEVLQRNGAWTEELKSLVLVAQQIEVTDLVSQQNVLTMDDLLTQKS